MSRRLSLAASALPALLLLASGAARADYTPSAQSILAESSPSEWRTLDPAQTLYMKLAHGHMVVIELAPAWAPEHVANIKTLVREHYFDGTSIYRVQDNFVAQWGDPDGDDPKKARPMGTAKTTLPPEFTRKIDPAATFTQLPDGDVYAPEVGFVNSMPAARDPKSGKEWLVQCYGMVGVSRDNDPTSGNANTLYVPIGQAPRRLDRQLTVVGRVVEGMQWIASLPRGPEPLGIYKNKSLRMPIESVRLAADVPAGNRLHLQVLRTDSKTFARLVEANRNRHDAFYQDPPDRISICDVPLPVREVGAVHGK